MAKDRLHEEFRRHVKTQGSLPSEDAALVLLFSLVASGPIKLRRIDGWQKIGSMLDAQPAYGRGCVMIVCVDSEPCKRL